MFVQNIVDVHKCFICLYIQYTYIHIYVWCACFRGSKNKNAKVCEVVRGMDFYFLIAFYLTEMVQSARNDIVFSIIIIASLCSNKRRKENGIICFFLSLFFFSSSFLFIKFLSKRIEVIKCIKKVNYKYRRGQFVVNRY